MWSDMWPPRDRLVSGADVRLPPRGTCSRRLLIHCGRAGCAAYEPDPGGAMPVAELGDGATLFCRADDFTDPWTKPDTVVMVHASAATAGSGASGRP